MNKNQVVWGVSALSHDASLCVIVNNSEKQYLAHASHAERYSGKKNDSRLHPLQVKEAIDLYGEPSLVYWFENPTLKRARFLTSGDLCEAFSLENSPKRHMHGLGIYAPIVYGSHHKSHAAAVFYTRPWYWIGAADVLVADAIGEYETLTTWTGSYDKPLRKMSSDIYPKSLGLLYTAVTQHVGLKPNEEEFILMGMAAYGKFIPGLITQMIDAVRAGANFHKGLDAGGIDTRGFEYVDDVDLALAVQTVVEHFMVKIATATRLLTGSKHLCLSGGVALNCVANARVAHQAGYEDIWILPNPGDAGSSLGAILQHTEQRIHFPDAFLGTNIPQIGSDKQVVDHLLKYKVAGLARGRAEWGPRALGNRSLLADPRTLTNKALVNNTKKRQQFRPFAPMVLDEFASSYFHLPKARRLDFMQYTAVCRKPEEIPAVIHYDQTARLQTIDSAHPCRQLLEQWYERTGCPVLLNTSLNIKGQPLVNNIADAVQFERKNRIRVFS
jgi:carbamoyltransferase